MSRRRKQERHDPEWESVFNATFEQDFTPEYDKEQYPSWNHAD